MVSNSGKTWKMVKFIRHLPEMEYGFVGVDEDDDIEEYKYFKRLRSGTWRTHETFVYSSINEDYRRNDY